MTAITDFVIADVGIRHLHARYTDAVWRKDYDAFGDCFAEDAEWRITGLVLRGRKAITEFIKTPFLHAERVMMTFRTPLLHVLGDGIASARTYVTEVNARKSGQSVSTAAIYWERFVRHEDQWRFTWRLFELHYMGSAEFTGPFIDNPDYGRPPNMPPLDTTTPPFRGTDWQVNK